MNDFQPWKIVHIELSEVIPTLQAEPKYQGIYAVFWWHSIPLGHQEISNDELPMPAKQLVNLALKIIAPTVARQLEPQANLLSRITLEQPLKKLQERFSQPLTHSVSVIVCTRNRPEELARCLRSLQNLSHPPHSILVVDNAPNSDATRQLVAQMEGIQYILEPRPGLSVARNTGIRHSTGDIIAFTDDDAMVHPDWNRQLQYGFSEPKVMAVTGLMLPAELETEAQFIFHKSSGGHNWKYHALTFDTQFFEDWQHRGAPVWRIGAGVNMAFRREIFDLVGYFDERLGAGASGCSEDSEFWYRILAEGWVCRYEPTAVIFHYHRGDISSLKHQFYQYMRGHVTALLVQFANYKHWGNLRRLFVALPRYYMRRIMGELKRGYKPKQSLLLSEITGCLDGVKFYFHNKNTPAWRSLSQIPGKNLSPEKISQTTNLC